MRVRIGLCIAAVMAVVCSAADAPKISVTRWPGDRTAAASLTFDDGMQTHIDIAGPILKKHGVHGTFFVLTGAEPWRQHLEGWKQLAADGNEIGNHTIRHPCLQTTIRVKSQTYTPEMMDADINDAAREIAEKIGNSRGMTFAYPCGNMTFGPEQDQQKNAAKYIESISKCCFAARMFTNGGSPAKPDELNIMNVIDLGTTDKHSFGELLMMLEPAVRDREWAVFAFHGVGGQWLAITGQTLDDLAGYLVSHPYIWTTTFGDGVRYTQERRALKIEATAPGADAVDAALTWPLDPKIYDLPLTLKMDLPAEWSGAKVEAQGRELPSKIVTNGKTKSLLIDVQPLTKQISIRRGQ